MISFHRRGSESELHQIIEESESGLCICSSHHSTVRIYAHAMQSSCSQGSHESPHRPPHLSLSGKARTCSASGSHVADHTTSVAETLNHPREPSIHAHFQSKQTNKKMSFEPKTKVELDPPKDDIISLDYLSKCDGELDSACTAQQLARSDVSVKSQAPTQTTRPTSLSRALSSM